MRSQEQDTVPQIDSEEGHREDDEFAGNVGQIGLGDAQTMQTRMVRTRVRVRVMTSRAVLT